MQDSDNKTKNRHIGKQFEDYAVEYLKGKGYHIVERNYRFRRYGEVDVIARVGDIICFVEVKSRRNDFFGTPAEAVTYYKKNKITFLAEHYLAQNNLSDMAVRFDVIEIYFSRYNDEEYSVESINHIEDAF